MPIVLVVEDDPDVRQALASVLRSEGYEVHTAVHGAEALDRLEFGLRPDVVLLDLMMPVMTGPELLTHLRGEPRWKNIPVIVASANRGYSHEDLGVRAVVRKPFEVDDLVKELRLAVA